MIALSIESGHAQLQRDFAEAILFDDAPIPATIRSASGPAHASRFGVYRNNVISGLINALAARYPVTRKLLWDDAFHAVARRYVATEPPRSPVMFEYGDGFPQFLREIGRSTASDYLADVAELEAARTRAYHAADATPLPREAFAAIAPEDLPELRLTLHPSVVLLASRFPVVSIWEANRSENDNMLRTWRPECALIARPYGQVEVRPLSVAVHAFVAALADGCTLDTAIAKGGSDFDLAEGFATLISAEIVRDPGAR
ncbi:HvfC/BufC N-terminal domain-containing protein [Rhodoplanes sp. Z2-YC6860]|uniref:HvfC/BufC N-terminal domain-containing protein n=1 Tax=Rhodoplanes sp. Z2-YC6860 TaxID=674703 RepID=UPI00078DDE44|nr:DNA-binding domain-containing protein [Rhodoplanes sp. Z2-YC6860]AMN45031.1 hypothetical protein RHPLAN_66250 [Rhodoplanes sp. Z2-YC6860]